MPIINLQRTVTLESWVGDIGGDPSAKVFETYVDLPLELSKLYSKNIRQGCTVNVKGVQVAMRAGDSGYDVGLASTVRFAYCPSTKHSRDAWKSMFTTWRNQKQLRAGAIGRHTRYDDLEYGYNLDHKTWDIAYGDNRISSLYQGGLADSTADKMVLYGSSSENNQLFSLQDHFDSLQQAPTASRYSVNNAVVKPPKFQSEFPLERHFWATSEASSVATFENTKITVPGFEDPEVTLTHLGGSNSTADIHLLPETAPALCGLLKISGWVIPDDTIAQVEDVAIMNITIWVDSWKNIFATRKFKWNRSMKKQPRRSYTSRYNKKSRRRK